MEFTPEASRLVLLSQLSRIAAGTKVRFLGWCVLPHCSPSTLGLHLIFLTILSVEAYNGETGNLKIRERFSAASSNIKAANVNVDNILDSLNLELTQVGAWVNIIGYCRQSEEPSMEADPVVDAVIVWSAGAIKLDEYEAAVRALQAGN